MASTYRVSFNKPGNPITNCQAIVDSLSQGTYDCLLLKGMPSVLEGVSKLAEAIKTHISLRRVEIYGSTLNRTELGDLVLAVSQSSSISCFKVEQTDSMSDKLPWGRLALNHTITSINITECPSLCGAVSAIFPMRSLHSLRLSNNTIGNEKAEALFKAAITDGGIPKCLDLSNNVIDDEGASKLALLLPDNKQFQTVLLHGNPLTEKGGRVLVGAFLKCSVLNRLTLPNGDYSTLSGVSVVEEREIVTINKREQDCTIL